MVFGINTLLGGPYYHTVLSYMTHLSSNVKRVGEDIVMKAYHRRNAIPLPIGGPLAPVINGGRPEVVTLYPNA